MTFPYLAGERCIALTTFRKNGQAVMTPVWFTTRLGTIYVETQGNTGKLKRLRHTPRVTFAPCTFSGKITGADCEGYARIVTAPEESAAAAAAFAKKYGVMRDLFQSIRSVRRRLRRKAEVVDVYIAIQASQPTT
jgi:PPOX class probable F420-dependent enzyme